jgi:hypothetical protein
MCIITSRSDICIRKTSRQSLLIETSSSMHGQISRAGWYKRQKEMVAAAAAEGSRDHDVDIIAVMEALCFCSLPNRLWPRYPYSIYSGSYLYIQLIDIHAFAPNSHPQFLRLFKRHLPRRTPTSWTSSSTYRKTGSS